MKRTLLIFCFIFLATFLSKAQEKEKVQETTSLPEQYQEMMNKILSNIPTVNTGPAAQLLDFTKSLLGTPYRYATSNPNKGFDCSGFVSYVFSNFGFKVPRSSTEFANTGVPIKLTEAKVGDVLIFTGTNPRVRRVGHVGIIYSIKDGEIKFIHSTSGKAHGVTITNFDAYYKSRFIKAVSIIE